MCVCLCVSECVYIDIYMYVLAQKKCYFSTAGAMDMPVSKLFVDAYFPEASRDAAGKTRRVALSPVLEKTEKGVMHDTAESPPQQAIREVP